MNSPSLQVQSRAFWLPKAGNAREEYEDAFAFEEGGLPVRAAVADGATEASYARQWARQLVSGFMRQEAGSSLPEALPALQEAWKERTSTSGDRPWYAQAKAEEGAHAAFLGLMLQPEGRWQARAVGDCCLFHLSGDEIQVQWPISSPEVFTHRPALLPSRPAHAVPEVRQQEGAFVAGDAFLLATDALAAWLMRAGPWVALSWDTTAFTRVIQTARAEGRIRNDDVTLLVLKLIR